MRLFFIDKPGCRHISKIVKGVSAVYQMEQEFHPYLLVDFLPNYDGEPGGIILQAGDEIIRKNYTFETGKDINELRDLIWIYLKKYHKVKNLNLKDGRYDWQPTNRVLQGWQEKKRNLRRDICCKIIREAVARAFSDIEIKHWVYRDQTTPHIDRMRCKRLRWKECGDNYPPESPLYARCFHEVEWLCNHGYPPKGQNPQKNKTLEKKDEQIVKLRKKIHDYLMKYDLKVNKQQFDQIITAGLFDHVGNRMGNKSNNLMNLRDTVDRVMWEKDYYSQMIEGFDESSEDYLTSSEKYSIYWIIVSVLIILFTLVFISVLRGRIFI